MKAFPKAERPKSALIFWTFRIMVAIGLAMIGLSLWGAWARLRGILYTNLWLHRAAVLMAPAGFIAVLAGWITTEVGRQPWTVYGMLRTADSIAPVDAAAVGASLVAFIVVYFVVFGAGTYYIFQAMARTPNAGIINDVRPTRVAGIKPDSTRALVDPTPQGIES